jgi:hypothetical protein
VPLLRLKRSFEQHLHAGAFYLPTMPEIIDTRTAPRYSVTRSASPTHNFS